MRCPNCNNDIPEGKKFCGFCGTRLVPPEPQTQPTEAGTSPPEEQSRFDEERPTSSLPQEVTPDFDEDAPTSLAPEQIEEVEFDEEAPTSMAPEQIEQGDLVEEALTIKYENPEEPFHPGPKETISDEPDREAGKEAHPSKLTLESGAKLKSFISNLCKPHWILIGIVGILSIAIIVVLNTLSNRQAAFQSIQQSLNQITGEVILNETLSAMEASWTQEAGATRTAAAKASSMNPTSTPQPLAEEYSISLPINEDFANPDSNSWLVEKNEDGWASFEYEGYLMGGMIISTIPDLIVSDVVVEASYTRTHGKRGDVGIICRSKDKKYYKFFCQDEFEWCGIDIVKNDGQAYRLGSFDNQPLKFLHRNKIKAECVGNRLNFYLNDSLIGFVSDDEIKSGEIGLFIDEGNTLGGNNVLFDDFSAYSP